MQKTGVGSLGRKDPLEKEMATHSGILAWEIPWTEEPGGLQSVLLCSVTKSCNPMDCSPPGFPIPHCLPEFAQTRVHWVSDAIQPSYPLSPSSLSTLNLSQHQGLFYVYLILWQVSWYSKVIIAEVIYSIEISESVVYTIMSIVLGEKKKQDKILTCVGELIKNKNFLPT